MERFPKLTLDEKLLLQYVSHVVLLDLNVPIVRLTLLSLVEAWQEVLGELDRGTFRHGYTTG